MKNPLKLDEEEVKILQDFERGELTSLANFKQEKRQLEEAAHNFLQKDKRINIRISSRDLEALQKKSGKGRDALPNPHLQHTPQIRDRKIEKRGMTNSLRLPLP